MIFLKAFKYRLYPSLVKSISDSGWGMSGKQCEDKAVINGSSVHRVDRVFPSSKKCNVCGAVNSELKLHHCFWTCERCKTEHDRDINASINLRNACTAGAVGSQACGEDVKPTTFLGGRLRLTSTKQKAQCL